MSNKVSLGEAKAYIGLDGEEQNQLLAVFLESAETICEKVLREPITDDMPAIVKTTVLFAVWQLYFHRDDSEFNAASLETTIAIMLSDIRRQEF